MRSLSRISYTRTYFLPIDFARQGACRCSRTLHRAGKAVAPCSTAQSVLTEFSDWLERSGVTGFTKCKVAFKYDSETGDRGLFCKQSVQEGELLLEIPAGTLLSEDTGLPQVIGQHLTDSFDTETRLALALTFQKSLGRDSPWYYYIEALPPEICSPYGSWPATELPKLQLDESGLSTEKLFRRALGQKLPDVFLEHAKVPSGFASEAVFRWALSVVHSRAFENPHPTPASNFSELMLVPLLDMFNHGGLRTGLMLSSGIQEIHTNTTFAFVEGNDAQEPGIRLTALRDIDAGEEALIDYGDNRPASEFFLSYGFVPPRNPFERAALFDSMQQAVRWYCQTFGLQVEEKVLQHIEEVAAAASPHIPSGLADDVARAIFNPLRVLANGAVDPRLSAAFLLLDDNLEKQQGRFPQEIITGGRRPWSETLQRLLPGWQNRSSFALGLRALQLLAASHRTTLLHDLRLLGNCAALDEREAAHYNNLLGFYNDKVENCQQLARCLLDTSDKEQPPGSGTISGLQAMAVKLRVAEKQVLWNFCEKRFLPKATGSARQITEWLAKSAE